MRIAVAIAEGWRKHAPHGKLRRAPRGTGVALSMEGRVGRFRWRANRETDMSTITRRALVVSAVGLATGAFLAPAEAATGSVALHIASAGFIFGVTGGSGTLTFRGRQYPLSIGGISAGALIGASATDLIGTAS